MIEATGFCRFREGHRADLAPNGLPFMVPTLWRDQDCRRSSVAQALY